MVRFVPQRVQRIVEQIVEGAKRVRQKSISERLHEQTVDISFPEVVQHIVKVPRISIQMANRQWPRAVPFARKAIGTISGVCGIN